MSEEQILELFHHPFDRSTEIDNTFVKIWHDEGIEKAIDYLKSVGATSIDFKSYEIQHRLNEATKSKYTKEEKEQLLKSLIDDKEVFKAEIKYNEEKDMDEVILETISGTMRMFTFSDLSDQVLEELPELVTNEREGQCYRLTYNINRHLGLPHEMVTGYVYGYTDISRFLHSWIELTYKGEEYVIDGTMNALIDKKAYYTLKKCQPITRISDETFQSDLDNHMDLLNGVNIEVYLIYRDEIISGQPLKPEKFNIGTGPTFK